MKLWTVKLTPEGAVIINKIRANDIVVVAAYFCSIRDGCLVFQDIDEMLICTFAPAYWVMAEKEGDKE